MRLIDADALVVKLKDWRGDKEDVDMSDPHDVGYYAAMDRAVRLTCLAHTIDAAPVVNARWEWFEEWSPSTQEHFAECDEYGWRCGRCKTALKDMVDGYWDDSLKEPELKYCPNCGVKMDGE